jgi:hypothetical protein
MKSTFLGGGEISFYYQQRGETFDSGIGRFDPSRPSHHLSCFNDALVDHLLMDIAQKVRLRQASVLPLCVVETPILDRRKLRDALPSHRS